MPTVNDPNNNPQGVLPKGYAMTIGPCMELSAHAADEGDAFSVSLQVDTTAATCDFFYMKNSDDKFLRIYKIMAKTHTADVQVQIKTGVTGTPAGSTNLTPVNSLVGHGNIVTAGDVQYRDGGDMALAGGSIYDTLWLDAAMIGMQTFDYPAEIALQKNQTLIFHAVADSGG